MPMLAATNGSPELGDGSSGRRERPRGSKSKAATETDDQRNANWFSARLASAFQIACKTAAHTTSAMAGPLTGTILPELQVPVGLKTPLLTRVCGIGYASKPMITVPTRRVKQFGVEFYQAGLSAKDIDRLVKFEVLGYAGGPQNDPPKKTRMNLSLIH